MKIGPVILTLVAIGGCAAGATFRHQRNQLSAQLTVSTAAEAALQNKLGQAEGTLADTRAKLGAAQADQAETRTRLTAIESSAAELRRELADARNRLAEAGKQLTERDREVDELRRSLAFTKLEVAQAGADEVAGYQAAIAALEEQIATLTAPPPSDPESPPPQTPAPPAAPVPVLSVGPDSAFVVLGFGASDGARIDHTLEIRRGTEALATVLITRVLPHHAIAQVRPDTLRAGLHKGDLATITSSP